MGYVMNEAEKKLVEALRSGKYKQTVGALRRENRFCCLGVACDVLGGSELWRIEENHFSYEGRGGYLPDRIRLMLNWASDSGATKNGSSLSNRNDDRVSFLEIANVIEQGSVLKVGEFIG